MRDMMGQMGLRKLPEEEIQKIRAMLKPEDIQKANNAGLSGRRPPALPRQNFQTQSHSVPVIQGSVVFP